MIRMKENLFDTNWISNFLVNTKRFILNVMAEPMFDVDDYDDEYYDDYNVEAPSRISQEEVIELYKYCMQPTVSQAYANLLILFSCCLIYRIVSNAIRTPDTSHILSSAIGTYMLYIYFKWDVLHTLALTAIGYLIILILSNIKRTRGYITSVLLISYLVICEKIWVEPSTWVKIRGPQMILAMKIISLAFDLDSKTIQTADIFEYVGYTLCPGSCIWGPWIPFTEYRDKQERTNDGLWWILKGILYGFLSLFYFITSTCLLEFFIPDNWGVWWVVYRDALIFRTSHYFVSSISEASCLLSGYDDKVVSRPWKVEYPRSLLDVVVNWNVPMHTFLKTYVFKTTVSRWGAFMAIMMTYLMSSLLHGLSPKLAAILLSLGFYTFTEHSIRLKLSKVFNACLEARSCPTHCPKHGHTQSNLIVNLTNMLLTFVAIFHLAYLGALMDTSAPADSTSGIELDWFLSRWHSLDYISHWIVFCTFIFNIFLSIFRI